MRFRTQGRLDIERFMREKSAIIEWRIGHSVFGEKSAKSSRYRKAMARESAQSIDSVTEMRLNCESIRTNGFHALPISDATKKRKRLRIHIWKDIPRFCCWPAVRWRQLAMALEKALGWRIRRWGGKSTII